MANWTEEQLRALDARGNNILLSAAAGSGKTTVLVERVLRLIEDDGARIDRMLIVTFTRAASADMRRKLGEKLGERASQGSAPCLKAQTLLERASISTLHGFCSEFLRSHFESAGVDPAFRVLDEAEARRIAEAALDETLEEAYAEPDEALRALTYGRRTSGVRELTANLVRFLDDRDDPEGWLERFCTIDADALERMTGELKKTLAADLSRAARLYRQAIDDPECTEGYGGPMRRDLEKIDAMRACEDFDAMLRLLRDFAAERVSSAKAKGGAPSDAVKDTRTAAAKILKEHKFRDLDFATLTGDMRAMEPQLKRLAALALRAREIGLEKRAALSGLSYNDLEQLTIRALRDDAVAASLREQYDYIFVDEYQDTSELQEALITRIARADNLFMVGDVKQSIYSFRNAEPRLFRRKYDAYRRGEGGLLLPLTRNFRSCEGIIALVNRTFELAMHGGDSEIEYDALARLNPGNPELTGGIGELHLLKKPTKDEREDDEQEECMRQASFIAQRIIEMRREDPSLSWRDFAILTRTRANLLGKMADVLAAYGIPAYANDAGAYYETVEISLAVSLLKLIVNRRCDYELVGVLRSPLTGLTLNELTKIRLHHPAGALADAAWDYAHADDAERGIADRLNGLYDRLKRWELLSHCLELGVLCRTVFNESGLYDMACGLPGGALRQANLDKLCENAAAYDRDISGSLSRFLTHLEQLKKSGEGEETHVTGENDDVVRLMTAHKSKGLEFPIVFGAMLQRSFARGGKAQPLAAHKALGMGFDRCDPELGSQRRTLMQHAVRCRRRREEHAEELRVLYVLMTRAKDRLILVGSCDEPEAFMADSRRLREDPDDAQSNLELLCCALGDGADGLCDVTIHPYTAEFEAEALPVPEVSGDAEADAELARLLAWRYPDADAARRPLKLTVTGLLRELHAPDADALSLPVPRPAFLSEDGGKMSGAEQGTAFHRVMECLDLKALRGLSAAETGAEIERQADALCAKRRLSAAQRAVVSVPALTRFLTSPTGRRLVAAEEVRREWPFNVMMRMSEALTEAERPEGDDAEILVQGTPDCCFIEDGAWVLLDYKTDRITDAEALTTRYGDQLRMYALALERITGIPVREIDLCLLRTGETIPIGR